MNKLQIITLTLGLIGVVSCSKLDDPNLISLNNVISIGYESDSILTADGNDRITLTANTNTDNVAANQNVTFTTEQGRFVGQGSSQSITVRSDGHKAKVILISDTKVNQKVQVSAKVGEYIVYGTVTFTNSLPDDIYVTSTGYNLSNSMNSKIYLDVNLKKSEGEVSNDTKVEFDVIRVVGNPRLYVLPVIWNKGNQFNRSELSSMSIDTGIVKIVPKVSAGNSYKYGKDTVLIKISK